MVTLTIYQHGHCWTPPRVGLRSRGFGLSQNAPLACLLLAQRMFESALDLQTTKLADDVQTIRGSSGAVDRFTSPGENIGTETCAHTHMCTHTHIQPLALWEFCWQSERQQEQ